MAPIGNRSTWSEPSGVERAAADVERSSSVVTGPEDLDALIHQLSDAQYVLLGEASHGTSEFYRWRAQITARLIADHDFDFVAVEGDWTSCYDVNQFVKEVGDADRTIREVIETFGRWPTWMWANWEMVEFFEWLRLHNREFEPADVGFFGLDVYSLFESMEAVIDYLEDVDPEAADHAREAYRCFEPYGRDAQKYAGSLRMVPESCEDEVVEILTQLREAESIPDSEHPDDRFSAEQNALVAKNAEAYYRALASGHTDSWNVRDEHMADTLDRLVEHHGGDANAIIWAHNTHVGDARATDMERKGRHNIGQLVRERHDVEDVELVGFGTHSGRVVAGDEWGAPMEVMDVPDATAGSYEDVFHRAGAQDRLLFTEEIDDGDPLAEPRSHRAIGVVYHPEFESGNYVPTDLRDRYDAFVHVDATEALHPLELHPDRERVPELYPVGL